MDKAPKPSTKQKRGKRGMGRLYKKANGKTYPADSKAKGNYYLTYTVNGKRVTTALKDSEGNSITDREEAEVERKRILAPFAAGDEVEALKALSARLSDAQSRQATAIATAGNTVKLSDAWQEYEKHPERPQAGAATLKQYSFQWGRFMQWITISNPDVTMLRDVSSRIAREYHADLLQAGVSPATVNKHIGLLRLLFGVVNTKPTVDGEEEVLPNPFSKIKLKKHKVKSRRELTTAELRRIVDLASGELKLLIALGIYTGMRLGDCATLKWDEVELVRNRILRVPNKTADNGKPISIPIFPTLKGMLQEAARKRKGEYVLIDTACLYRNRPNTITSRIRRLFWNAGIDCHAAGTGKQIKRDEKGCPIKNKHGNVIVESTDKRGVVQCGFHSLRHTFVSLCSEANTPMSVVQSIVGHSNPAMTRHYTHTSELEAAKAIASLPDFSCDDTTYNEPLPAWARDLVEGMTSKTWKQVKQKLLDEYGKKPGELALVRDQRFPPLLLRRKRELALSL